MTSLVVPEEKILTVSKTTLVNAQSKIDDLSEFGINEAMLASFESKINEAESLPDEKFNKIELRELTDVKNEALEACHEWGRKLAVRMEMAFGRDSDQVSQFPHKELTDAKFSESRMMPLMETLIDLATQYQSELSVFGQSEETLTGGTNKLEALREADNAQEIKKDTKKEQTEIRHILFNDLYNTVNRINKIGRVVFNNSPSDLRLFESKW